MPELELATYGFTEKDLDRPLNVSGLGSELKGILAMIDECKLAKHSQHSIFQHSIFQHSFNLTDLSSTQLNSTQLN